MIKIDQNNPNSPNNIWILTMLDLWRPLGVNTSTLFYTAGWKRAKRKVRGDLNRVSPRHFPLIIDQQNNCSFKNIFPSFFVIWANFFKSKIKITCSEFKCNCGWLPDDVKLHEWNHWVEKKEWRKNLKKSRAAWNVFSFYMEKKKDFFPSLNISHQFDISEWPLCMSIPNVLKSSVKF